MKIIITFLFFSLSIGLSAQSQGRPNFGDKSGISGFLVDSISQNPVRFAAVDAIKKEDQTIMNGMFTDSTGRFFIELENGEYLIKISSVNHETYLSQLIVIDENAPVIKLGKIFLKPSGAMKAITINVNKALVENKIDRMVYNVEQDITNDGTSVIDMLRKVPMVEVDGDGNVSIRGGKNIRVFIDGRPSAVVNGNLQDALQSIPSDLVERVEVITNPSAKYDAEGTAGIINLVMKQSKIKGTTGNLRTGVGNRSTYLGAGVAAQYGKTGLNFRLGGHFWRAITESNTVRTNNRGGQEYLFEQKSKGTSLGGGPRISFGLDHAFNDKNAISLSVSGRGRLDNSDQDFVSFDGIPSDLKYLFSRSADNRGFSYGLDISLNYLKKFEKKSRELNFGLQYGGDNKLSSYNVAQYDTTFNRNQLTYQEKSNNTAINSEYTAQVDLTEPLKEWAVLEVGLKSIIRRVNSTYSFDTLNQVLNEYQSQESLGNTFEYFQNVFATYAQLQFKLNEVYSLRIGTRYEYTSFSGKGGQAGQNFTGKPYDNLIPFLLINRPLGKAGFIKFGYNNRLQRPGLFFINPYQNLSDPNNVSQGNPTLDAELSHNFELSTGKYGRKGGGSLSAYHRRTNNAIETIREVNSDRIYTTTYGNVGRSFYQGVDGNANINSKKTRLNINAGIGYAIIESTSNEQTLEGLRTAGITYNFGMGGSFNLPKNCEISGFARINSPDFNLQGFTTNWYFHTFGLKKRFKNKRGGIGLGVDNPFTPYVYYKTINEGNNFKLQTDRKAYQLGLKINFDYKFGKLETEKETKTKFKEIQNNDVKKEGSGGSLGGE